MLKNVFSFILTMILLVTNLISSNIPGNVPEPEDVENLAALTEPFEVKPLAEEIVVIKSSVLTRGERCVIASLQGLVGRTEASIFIDYGYDSKTELADLEAAGCTILYADENGEVWNFEKVINRFRSHIRDDGYILFGDHNTDEQLNMGFNYSTVYGWLAVPADAEERVKALGLEKKEDISDDKITVKFQRDFYEEHKDLFNKKVLIHQYAKASGLFDLAVQQNIFIYFADEETPDEVAFRNQIYRDLEPASMILGWCNREVAHVEAAARYGHYVIPSDHSFNMSVLTCNRIDNPPMSDKVEAPELDPDKHYVAIVYSDGDNAQWISNGFSEYYTWQSYNIDTPITWTFAPQMNLFSSTAVKKALENNNGDSFITGPSGAGYARIDHMSVKEVEKYSKVTAATMEKSGMRIMTLLNDVPSNAYADWIYANKLECFARYDNIDGGIIQMDNDYYAGGHGRVYFVNDKPFVSVRVSLWHPSGDPSQVTKEWLKEQADIVNNSDADINSINGYSVINVHPWTVGPDDLAYFVSCLGENVEVISAAELVAAVEKNVPHKSTKVK